MTLSIVIPALNETRSNISKTVDAMMCDESVSEVIVVDDGSFMPVSIKGVKIIRNKVTLGSAISREIGILAAKSEVVLTTDAHVNFVTKNWGEEVVEWVLKHPKGIACPVCVPKGDCSFKGKIYGGYLDIIAQRSGGAIILEPRWNTNPENNIDCVMGGAYAFSPQRYRQIRGYTGIKGWCLTELVSISLKNKLFGGTCSVLSNVEMEHEFKKKPAFQVENWISVYNKMRLAYTILPMHISSTILTLLSRHQSFKMARKMFVEDFPDIVNEKTQFLKDQGMDAEDVSKKAGLTFW